MSTAVSISGIQSASGAKCARTKWTESYLVTSTKTNFYVATTTSDSNATIRRLNAPDAIGRSRRSIG